MLGEMMTGIRKKKCTICNLSLVVTRCDCLEGRIKHLDKILVAKRWVSMGLGRASVGIGMCGVPLRGIQRALNSWRAWSDLARRSFATSLFLVVRATRSAFKQ